METKNAVIPSFLPKPDISQGRRSLQTEQTKVTAAVQSRSMEVNLTTEEGDKVTISLDAKSAALYGLFEQRTTTEKGTAYQGSALTIALHEREMTFAVEGELNEDELRDIRKTLKTLDRMMNHFVNGRLKPMLAESQKIEGLESIAGLEAQFSYSRTVLSAEQSSSVSQSTAEAAGSRPSTPNVLQAARPADQAIAQLTEKSDALARQMADIIAASRTHRERMKSLTAQLLDNYKQQFGQDDSLGRGIMERISGRLDELL